MSCPLFTWRFGGQSVSSCQRNAVVVLGDKLTIIGKVSRGMTGQGPVDERRYLEHHETLVTYGRIS